MGFEKSIDSGKEHRKHYRGSKSVASSCRNHGGCPWCEENRMHGNKIRESKNYVSDKEIKDILNQHNR